MPKLPGRETIGKVVASLHSFLVWDSLGSSFGKKSGRSFGYDCGVELFVEIVRIDELQVGAALELRVCS